ncbi:OFA family MFS transporter [Pseudonocardia sp. KRD-184]|uniref:OFA family MFS transporter n=1 Tax=Pseudonocardia oceani TaxID=2792013 RepID=A0ABS6U5W3_9PSEU|nr:OFA family MFS transporter [Pseudonocardia oceani]MBW0093899.1 OFA family MFS transporter [Pseudonocardia oceani]MBW0100471.1 OFA family MFS transporter [Pseudonocardia oceani]MBW0125688.1 OFA family MFS transporter [Pseudonocardia oceani]MBW0127376.1 OFA family MFS transporter [Pseudonocardia oceani]
MAAGFLQRERIVAPPGWSRWLIPPAALSIHLAIGQAYAWSVFKTPLADTILAGNPSAGVLSALPFTLGIIMLGLSAALFGTKVDANGPRWAMVVATSCFVAGFLISAAGMYLGQYWLVIVGYGFVGGIGLGVGYISPVSTLIKWFPDRPGLSTGIAIMGFGGGALIATPLTTSLLGAFGGSGDGAQAAGIGQTFLVMGLIYAVFMSVGWLLIRVPAPDWKPEGWQPDRQRTGSLISTANVSAANAIKTPQFWLLWVVLCFNVTAGIGILERASPIFQDFFQDSSPAETIAASAAGFVAILSLANALGRILWSSLSDVLGRKNMYRIYLGVGALLYLLITLTTNSNRAVFLISALFILSFYGAGFATVPAYLRDLFGTYQVGAIHGRLLTAWSTAGVLGPVIVNAIADAQIAAGVEGPGRYTMAFSIMIGLLVVAFVCNELIRPVNEKYHETETTDSATAGAQA